MAHFYDYNDHSEDSSYCSDIDSYENCNCQQDTC